MSVNSCMNSIDAVEVYDNVMCTMPTMLTVIGISLAEPPVSDEDSSSDSSSSSVAVPTVGVLVTLLVLIVVIILIILILL